MAAKSRSYAITSAAEELYQWYYFIASSGQTALEIYSDGGTPAVYKSGTGYVSSFASAADCTSGSYFVFRPVSANGGVRWYVKVKYDTGNTLKVTCSPDGTWSNGGAGPGSFSGVQTNETTVNDAAAPGAASSMQFHCATVSYNGGSNTYTYLWVNIRDTGDATPQQWCYMGGYRPFNASADTKPFVFLARIPTVDTTNLGVGANVTTSNQLSRCATEYAHSTTFTTSGYCRIGLIDTPTAPGATSLLRTFGGEYLGLPAYIFTNAGNYCLGDFYDQVMCVDQSKASYDTNTAATYIKLGHLWLAYDLTN